ncbi:DUF2378 family protein [Myxococcus sp. AM009]|uniref:DUF2378 family protein n=1 Tax=unclassified Myxococcus TaxID=2648731 RepID=UPI0015957F8B|nr:MULTISPECIES: DUF2378 family protein [unclassified Myxococcus]NVJ02574.1 DUF2378 family protein [Myxococcus sp. AM009]NVJ19188.1 DUF2378 family protein [Myxococcus sp. AM010]
MNKLDPNIAKELEARLALATKDDTARGLFFNGVVSAVRTMGGDAAVERCLAASGETRFIDFFNYPVSAFLRMSFTAAQMMGPEHGGFDGALRRMGVVATTDFLSSAAGKTLLLLASDSPKRLVGNLHSGYRAAVSYGERAVKWTGDTSGIFTMKRDFMPPAYHEGTLQAVIEAVGGKQVQVHGRQTGPLDTEYTLSWH